MNETVCTHDLKCIQNGLLLVDAILNDVDVGNHSLGFFTYSTIILQFKRQLLEIIFLECHRLVLSFGTMFLNQQLQPPEIFELSIQVLCKLLEFPFDPNYATFNSEISLQEGLQVTYPPTWYPMIRCQNFLSILIQVACSQHSSLSLVKLALSAFNSVLGARPEGKDVAEVERLAGIAVDALPLVCCLLQRRLAREQSESILEILAEQATRTIKWFKLSKMLKAGSTRFNLWTEALIAVTQAALRTCPEVSYC